MTVGCFVGHLDSFHLYISSLAFYLLPDFIDLILILYILFPVVISTLFFYWTIPEKVQTGGVENMEFP